MNGKSFNDADAEISSKIGSELKVMLMKFSDKLPPAYVLEK
jgi:hypothetical protein